MSIRDVHFTLHRLACTCIIQLRTLPSIQACFVGASSLRVFAAEALTLLIRTSLESHSEEVPRDNYILNFGSKLYIYDFRSHSTFQSVQLMLLRPLESMTRVPHPDVRQKQMDCITHVCVLHV